MSVSTLTSSVHYVFGQYWTDVQDPRTAHFPLISGTPYPVLGLMAAYVYFSLSLGPRIMAARKPMDLRPVMLLYNFVMAALNAYFVVWYALNGRLASRLVEWQYPDRSVTSAAIRTELTVVWWYWMTKFADLLDTIFFVLKKKHATHISFLHLYHHSMVPVYGYLVLKHNATIPVFLLFNQLNGTLHVIMYSYYGLCLLGPAVRPYLWWKRYLTQLQILQFVCLITYMVAIVVKQQGYPKFWLYFGLSQLCAFLVLFYNFYRRSYSAKAAVAEKQQLNKPKAN